MTQDFEKVKLKIQWVEWGENVNWGGRWVADKERDVVMNSGTEGPVVAPAEAASTMAEQRATERKANKTAYQLAELAFQLRYIREELIRKNVFLKLSECRSSIGDAAVQLEILADMHRGEVKHGE